MKQSAFAITLVILMAGSVLAQSRAAKTFSDTDPASVSSLTISKIEGIESAKGTFDQMNSVNWGRTFTLMNDNVSLNLSPDAFINQLSEGSEDVNKVIGGSWAMIQRNSKMNGMLFGTIAGGGSINWLYDQNGLPTFAVIEIQLTITGGTDSFVDLAGPQSYGTFRGTVSYAEGSVPTVVGSFDLMF